MPILNFRNASAVLLYYCYNIEAPDGMVMKHHVTVYENDFSIQFLRSLPMLVNIQFRFVFVFRHGISNCK